MSRPTDEELEKALARAAKMREQDEDPYFVARSLLSHNYRLNKLQHVLEAAGHYLHSGNGPREHTALLHAIEEAKLAEHRPGEDPSDEDRVYI